MIINGFDAWLLNVSMNIDTLTFILCLVSGMLMPVIALSQLFTNRKKYTIIAVVIFAVSGLVQLIIPKPVVVEKYIVSKYSVPEIMDRFDSYDAFYNQIGLEIREITANRRSR